MGAPAPLGLKASRIIHLFIQVANEVSCSHWHPCEQARLLNGPQTSASPYPDRPGSSRTAIRAGNRKEEWVSVGWLGRFFRSPETDLVLVEFAPGLI